jgi:uncharacterized protein YaaW (UPF0174 family)
MNQKPKREPVLDPIILERLGAATKSEVGEICKALKFTKDSAPEALAKAYVSTAAHSVDFRLSRLEVPYQQILWCVAKRLQPWKKKISHPISKELNVGELEELILQIIREKVETELSKLTEDQRELRAKELQERMAKKGVPVSTADIISSSVAAGSLGAVLANGAALSVFYSGFFSGIWAAIFGPSTVLLIASGTGVGILVMVPALFILAACGPKYRKLVPATIQLIMIRKRGDAERNL